MFSIVCPASEKSLSEKAVDADVDRNLSTNFAHGNRGVASWGCGECPSGDHWKTVESEAFKMENIKMKGICINVLHKSSG